MSDISKIELTSQEMLLANDLERNWFALGMVLKQAYRHAKTEADFQDVCQKMNIGTRTGYYLIRLVRRFAQMELQPPTDVSWRMLVETLPCLSRDNYKQILAFCRMHTRDELIAAVKTHTFG